jgi:hypothetical protein
MLPPSVLCLCLGSHEQAEPNILVRMGHYVYLHQSRHIRHNPRLCALGRLPITGTASHLRFPGHDGNVVSVRRGSGVLP